MRKDPKVKDPQNYVCLCIRSVTITIAQECQVHLKIAASTEIVIANSCL